MAYAVGKFTSMLARPIHAMLHKHSYSSDKFFVCVSDTEREREKEGGGREEEGARERG